MPGSVPRAELNIQACLVDVLSASCPLQERRMSTPSPATGDKPVNEAARVAFIRVVRLVPSFAAFCALPWICGR